MNKRAERKKYITKFLNYARIVDPVYDDIDVDSQFAEELFIIECTKNEYAMKYVQDIIKEESVVQDVDFLNSYNLNVLFSQASDRLGYIVDTICFLKHAEDNNINLIRSLCIKSFKNLTRAVESHNEGRLGSNISHDVIVLFLFSLFNRDMLSVDVENVLCMVEANEIIASNFHDILVSKDQESFLLKKYSSCLKKLNIDINSTTTIQEISNYCLEKTLNFIVAHADNSIEEDDDFILNSKISLLKRQGYLKQELANEGIEYHMFVMYDFILETVGNSFYNSYFILNYEIDKVIVAESLFILDHLIDRNFIDISFIEKEFITILINRIVNKNLQDVVAKSITVNLESMTLCSKYNQSLSELQSKNDRLNSNLNDALTKISMLEEKIYRLTKERDNLKSTINKTNSKRKKDKDNKIELEALRGLFFSLENQEVAYDLDDIADDVIVDKKIAFIGSTNALHSKLKAKFDFIYIEADEQTRDLGFLKNMKHIFIHTHMPHSLYYKVFEVIKSSDATITFLNATNVDILNKEIRKRLSK